MKLLLSTLIFFGFLSNPLVRGQEIDRSFVAEQLLESEEKENIYVHYNTSLIFPGEYLMYSVYNLKDNGEVSNFSKIAYVELIGENGDPVFRQKLRLEQGRGSADLFIPTSTPSGSYKFLAYTNWMRNRNDAFFEGDVVVVNPYQSNQNSILPKDSIKSLIKIEPVAISDSRVDEKKQNEIILVGLNKKIFDKRERIVINLDGKTKNAISGNYSISVRKIGELPSPEKRNPESIFSPPEEHGDKNNEKFYLPELRGHLITGQILPKAGYSNINVENKRVVLSIPNNKDFAQFSATNREGQFFFNLDKEIREPNIILEVLGEEKNSFDIKLQENSGIVPNILNFYEYILPKGKEEEIVRRSLYNQIENSYFSIKPDTIMPVKEEVSFPEFLVDAYNLDEYTRFKGTPETFVEIIKAARIKNVAGENSEFEVYGHLNNFTMDVGPLIMVDGIFIQDHDLLVNYDASKLKSISIIRDKIFLGPEIFQGAVLVETIDGKFIEEHDALSSRKINFDQLEVEKKYFKQVYASKSKDNRIPDYRHQLFWDPTVELEQRGKKLELFTSDVDGNFEVVLEGFTADGKPVSVRKTFSVQ